MGTPFDVNFVDIAFAWHSEQVPSALALAMLMMRGTGSCSFKRNLHHAEQETTLPRRRQNFTGVLLIVGLEEGLLDYAIGKWRRYGLLIVFLDFIRNICFYLFPCLGYEHLWHGLGFGIIEIGEAQQGTEYRIVRVFH